MIEQEIHRQLSADCFNGVWDLLDKETRSEDENRLMREMAHASLFHWLQRDDATAENLSIGYRQISRVYSVLGLGTQAMAYAADCVEVSESGKLNPFFKGYAYEAMARAASLQDDKSKQQIALEKAQSCLDRIEAEGERSALAKDLEGLA